MRHRFSRRQFVRLASITIPAAAWSADGHADSGRISALYPTQLPELVQEMVVVSHGNVARVRELVGRQPTLAKAAWDWGFGDWETALGAASHVGNREIAELLLANGAHPTIFSAAMLGHLDSVKGFITALPGIQRTRGPHSISLLKHATAGGPAARAVVEYLKTVDGADDRPAAEPLDDADIAKLTGVYLFGPTPGDRFEITASNQQLQIGRPGHYARGLFHMGGLAFCAMGAETVRIRFAEAAGGMQLTVHDPDVVLTARKAAQPLG